MSNLRNNRPLRPTGSRPLPSRPSLPHQRDALPARGGSALWTRDTHEADRDVSNLFKRTPPLIDAPSNSLNEGSLTQRSVRAPRNDHRQVSPPLAECGADVYQESERRIVERHEAHDLRTRLAKLDQADEERLYSAARFEAADLVWRHQNPKQARVEKIAPYANPDLKKYGSLTSTKKAVGMSETGTTSQSRSTSDGSSKSDGAKKHRLPWLTRKPKAPANLAEDRNIPLEPSSVSRSATARKTSRDFNARRTISHGSSKGVFSNPEDEIYEEPETSPPKTITVKSELPLQEQRGNILLKGARPLPEKSRTLPLQSSKEIIASRPEPAQSGNASQKRSRMALDSAAPDDQRHNSESCSEGIEIRSEEIRAATSMRRSDRSAKLPTPTAVSDRPGRPIVSFDPAWKLAVDSTDDDKDEKLPGRQDGSVAYPIAPIPDVPQITIVENFENVHYETDPQARLQISHPPHSADASIPTINIEKPDSIPADQDVRPLPHIQLPVGEPSIPSICVDSPPTITIDSSVSGSRPLPSPTVTRYERKARPLSEINSAQRHARPSSHHTQTSASESTVARSPGLPVTKRVPWLDRTSTLGSRPTVVCAACDLSISGRIVTASGSSTASQKARFHPECFNCRHCSTSLECISFYPEPRNARLERMQSELPHLSSNNAQLMDLVDSNTDLHFFCHLDFHELFSPRCHTCKTPIEGQVVLALGRHYHPDHFFCAECGDPFTSESPFVEHNQYAYCVRCHTKRTSSRCKACKSPILDEMTIEALGGKWHDRCFVCDECGGDFGELGRFFVREVEVELTEKERRRGLVRKVEEKAACQGCEERRVKSSAIFV